MGFESLEVAWYVAMVVVGVLLSIKEAREMKEEEDA